MNPARSQAWLALGGDTDGYRDELTADVSPPSW